MPEAQDPCRGSQETTVQRADGSSTTTTPRTDPRPAVDCFYVYPTVSNQPQPNALRVRAPEVAAVAQLQAARFSTTCRVFAPVYRQRTLPALAAEDAFTPAQQREFFDLAYADVLAAWRSFLRRDSRGRGFVLLAHSQGTRILRKLVREQVDPRPALRQRLVSAVLPGADVLVRRGRTTGGDFRHVPVCERPRQTGCVAAWSTFDQPPPPDSRFGRPPATREEDGLPAGPAYEVVCTNPADLAGNRRRTARTVVRSEPFPGVIGLLLVQTFRGLPPNATTPYVVPAERYSVRCQRVAGAHVLLARPLPGARDLGEAPDETWGLHLTDVNLVLDDAVAMVRTQARAWAARR
nr:DUF3089 domain-containing protein [Nocardioides perillae]